MDFDSGSARRLRSLCLVRDLRIRPRQPVGIGATKSQVSLHATTADRQERPCWAPTRGQLAATPDHGRAALGRSAHRSRPPRHGWRRPAGTPPAGPRGGGGSARPSASSPAAVRTAAVTRSRPIARSGGIFVFSHADGDGIEDSPAGAGQHHTSASRLCRPWWPCTRRARAGRPPVWPRRQLIDGIRFVFGSVFHGGTSPSRRARGAGLRPVPPMGAERYLAADPHPASSGPWPKRRVGSRGT